jgi:virginiamycin A acetyltransferase
LRKKGPYAPVFGSMWRFVQSMRRRRRRLLDRLFMARLRRDGVAIGPGAKVIPGAVVQRSVTVGAGTTINRHAILKGVPPIRVGKFADVGEGVHVISENHLVNRASLNAAHQFGAGSVVESRGPVEIGNGVWIGDRAIVLAGVKIGDGSVVGAGSVVTRDVEPFTIVAGVPARPIRRRFEDEVIEALLAIRWWDWPAERLESNREFFAADLTAAGAAEFLRGFR